MLASAILKFRDSAEPFETTYLQRVSVDEWRPSMSISPDETVEIANDNARSFREELALRLSACQREMSLLAMHFSADFRARTLRQLKNLLDPDEWEDGDTHLQTSSFRSFIRAMAVLRPIERPMLGLSDQGNVLAMWASGDSRLTFEHLANDRLRWFISANSQAGPDSAAGVTTIAKLAHIAEAQGMRVLFDGQG